MGFSTGEAIEILGAALFVNVVTLMLVAVLAPVFPVKGKFRDAVEGVIVSFASGAIFGSAFLLLLLQSAVLLLLSHFDEPFGAIWRWAALVMAGYLTKGVTHIVLSLVVCNSVDELKNPTVTIAPLVPPLPVSSSKENTVTPMQRARVASGLLLGDVAHKLLDGLIIASTFSNCNPRVGWAITFSMVIKEVAHDISDYFLLVASSGAGFKPALALLVKFCFGMAIVLGTVPILVAEPSQEQTGLILSYAAGVYVHVAATEYMPRVLHMRRTKRLTSHTFNTLYRC
uniref:Uncharacterized protein n=1 Tax=Chrysotila carterae TaxID=13221 RepID=A0A7S4BIS1_CHRCT